MDTCSGYCRNAYLAVLISATQLFNLIGCVMCATFIMNMTTHTHTHAHAHMYTHMHMHTCTHTHMHTVLHVPPVLVPTNIHYDAPLDRPQLAEEILPDNVVFPPTEPPTVFPGMSSSPSTTFLLPILLPTPTFLLPIPFG